MIHQQLSGRLDRGSGWRTERYPQASSPAGHTWRSRHENGESDPPARVPEERFRAVQGIAIGVFVGALLWLAVFEILWTFG